MCGALKPSFTYSLYIEPSAKDLAENASLAGLRKGFAHFVGRRTDDVGAELGIRQSEAKDYAARVVHAAVLQASPLPASEFKAVGPTVRITRIDSNMHPYEGLSFPAFRHFELVEEVWPDSELLALLEHMLIIPVYGRMRETRQGDCVIRAPIYWTPTSEQLRYIEKEWTMFRNLITQGRADSLPTESQTSAIHVRPHGRDSRDRDPTPGGGSQTRKSFWLNKRFVQSILRTG